MEHTKLPTTIKLPNRDNLNINLHLISSTDKTYSLLMEDASYVRYSLDNNEYNDGYTHYQFIDPPGGPMIYPGLKLENDLEILDIKIDHPLQAYSRPIITVK